MVDRVSFIFSGDVHHRSIGSAIHTRIEYDAVNMKVTSHPKLSAYIKEPARKGWEYGENPRVMVPLQ
jgi:hypothetical protein